MKQPTSGNVQLLPLLHSAQIAYSILYYYHYHHHHHHHHHHHRHHHHHHHHHHHYHYHYRYRYRYYYHCHCHYHCHWYCYGYILPFSLGPKFHSSNSFPLSFVCHNLSVYFMEYLHS